MPLRALQAPKGPDMQLYRRFRYGPAAFKVARPVLVPDRRDDAVAIGAEPDCCAIRLLVWGTSHAGERGLRRAPCCQAR